MAGVPEELLARLLLLMRMMAWLDLRAICLLRLHRLPLQP